MVNINKLRPAYLEIDVDRFIYNINLVRSRIGENTKLMACVKANMYGLGIDFLLKYLEKENAADSYCVAILSEALQIRKLGTEKDILILGYTPRQQYEYLIDYNIMPTIFNFDDAKYLSKLAVERGKKVKIHIKIDTGMSRLGFNLSDNSIVMIEKISKLKGIKIDGIFTHFANSPAVNKKPSEIQAKKYYDFCSKLEKSGLEIGKKHISNSAAIVDMPQYNEDMVRTGYNLCGFRDLTTNYNNLPVLSTVQLKAKIVSIKSLNKGIGIGYGSTYVTNKEKTKIAVLPIGYSDGFSKSLENKSSVLVNGKLAPIRGLICMDQLMIEVTDIDCNVGDEVILYGYEEKAPNIIELGKLSNSNNINMVSSISYRVPRVYIKGGQVIGIYDPLFNTNL